MLAPGRACLPDRWAQTHSQLDLARPNIFVHHPITHEGIQRALEAGGFVVFKAEVADPGEQVAAKQAYQQPPEITRGHQNAQADQPKRGADEMQAAAGAITMLGQIERVKLGKAGDRFEIGRARHGGVDRGVKASGANHVESPQASELINKTNKFQLRLSFGVGVKSCLLRETRDFFGEGKR
jgi:hypothetical protein